MAGHNRLLSYSVGHFRSTDFFPPPHSYVFPFLSPLPPRTMAVHRGFFFFLAISSSIDDSTGRIEPVASNRWYTSFDRTARRYADEIAYGYRHGPMQMYPGIDLWYSTRRATAWGGVQPGPQDKLEFMRRFTSPDTLLTSVTWPFTAAKSAPEDHNEQKRLSRGNRFSIRSNGGG